MTGMFAGNLFPRPLAIVTGAGGGIGRACALRLAHSHRLVLTDIDVGRLDAIERTLRDEHDAAVVASIAGDIAEDSAIAEIASATTDPGLRLLVHAAGLSPGLAGWWPIVRANLIGTAKLMHAMDSRLQGGMVGILLSSTARCFVPEPDAGLSAELDDPLAPGLSDRLADLLGSDDDARAANAYAYTKWWVHRTVQQRAADWATRGARILSISPGFMLTPMTRTELEVRPEMVDLLRLTPAGRWGTPDDIVNLVDFLRSENASFMTGSDVVIDGGLTARMLAQA